MRKTRRLWRWIAILLALLVALALMDYLISPRLAIRDGRNFNHGENGLWLRYTWYFGEHTDSDISQLARRLREHQIRYAYFHVRSISRDGTLKFHHPETARPLVTALHKQSPGVKVLAWIYAGNERGEGEVDLANAAVRKSMVREALWLVTHCGFDGVQWDYEVMGSGDPCFPLLMKETRAALPVGKLLSAAVPMWLPAPLRRWGWNDQDFTLAAACCDQLVVMCYDSAFYLPHGYQWLLHQQVVHVTRSAALGNPHCGVLLGVPAYGKGGLSHDPHVENTFFALQGIRQGLNDPLARLDTFAGVALFADYTIQLADWKAYNDLWLGK